MIKDILSETGKINSFSKNIDNWNIIKSFNITNLNFYLEENQNESIFKEQQEIKQQIKDSLERKESKIKEIDNFNKNLNKNDFNNIKNCLKNIIKNTKYNSLKYLISIIQNNNWDIIKAFYNTNLNFSLEENQNDWTNCFWMSELLKEELRKKWIASNIIRFDAWWYLDNEYIKYWHCALVVPFLDKNNIKNFFLLDPWIFLSEPILFNENWSIEYFLENNKFIIRKEWKMDLDFCLKMKSEKKEKKFYFDPYSERINPEDSLNKNILRGLWKFKITKQDEKWKISNKILVDLVNNLIIFSDENEKLEINFQDLKNFDYKNNKLYKDLTEILTNYNHDYFFSILNKIVLSSEEYKEKIRTKNSKINSKNFKI